jgi:hypothetical protein
MSKPPATEAPSPPWIAGPHIRPLPSPGGGDMALWLVDLDAVPLALAASVLSAEDQARASRFRFEMHARRYQASHVALRQILGGVTQLDPSSLTFTEGSQGKPRLSLAHPTVHFNMSHSEGWALIGLSHLGPIGVDIELLAPMDDADLLAQRNFSATEYAAYLFFDAGRAKRPASRPWAAACRSSRTSSRPGWIACRATPSFRSMATPAP